MEKVFLFLFIIALIVGGCSLNSYAEMNAPEVEAKAYALKRQTDFDIQRQTVALVNEQQKLADDRAIKMYQEIQWAQTKSTLISGGLVAIVVIILGGLAISAVFLFLGGGRQQHQMTVRRQVPTIQRVGQHSYLITDGSQEIWIDDRSRQGQAILYQTERLIQENENIY